MCHSQTSKKSEEELAGRTDGNVKVIFPKSMQGIEEGKTTTFKPGDYVIVKVEPSARVARPQHPPIPIHVP